MRFDDYENVLGIVQKFINAKRREGVLTPEVINNRIEAVLNMDPKWSSEIDRNALRKELETRFSVWIGREMTLEETQGHSPWLSLRRNEILWRYSNRYRLFLENRWPHASIEALDKATDKILSLLEDPLREGPWDRRGLVVGHVQSGKTANYTELICKAADAGYKVIVVLAGLHNNLRSQTQIRLDEGFLGYESVPLREAQTCGLRPIGVGTIDPELRTDTITNRSEQGDFNRTVANNFSINPGGRPLLFVVKKNASVLRNLLDWVEWAANSTEAETGRRTVKDVPLLVIDDEADHASVDTRQQEFDENGKPDPDHDPTAINSHIRRLLRFFEKSAYVGYTATPFANIFVHDQGATDKEGDDLFPRSFIINLPAPSDYASPANLFGIHEETDDNVENNISALPLIRHVTDHADSPAVNERNGWMPPRHRNGHRPLYNGRFEIPPSLRQALHSFLLVCAARCARGQTRMHNSMLIHVTRFTSVQHDICSQVCEEINSIRQRLQWGDGGFPTSLLSELRCLWEEDFIPITQQINDPENKIIQWEDIENHLPDVVTNINNNIREMNGSAGDILDYEAHRETGLDVIAIGGDKLSRGLTLEGLTVSYFLRSTQMYDTLMQMGRWFGYRPGYLDLCRLYTTPDIDEWYQYITEAGEELRQEFDHMAAVGGTPTDYGLKIRAHPTLMITSRVKLKTGTEIQLSFGRTISETVVFHRDKQHLRRNFDAAEALISRLGNPEINIERRRPGGKKHRWKNSYLWSDVPVNEIKAFLSRFVTHQMALRVDTRLLHDYIRLQEDIGELLNWTVVVVSKSSGKESAQIAGLDIKLMERAPKQKMEDRYIIRRLLAPRDEAIDLDLRAYEIALQQTRNQWQGDPGRSRRKEPPDTPSGPFIRAQRDPRNELLLIYPLSPAKAEIDVSFPIIGFGISFPHTQSTQTVTYRVNNIYWSQEYGRDI